MWIYNPSLNCGRVNSVLVHNASYTDFVEIGYYESDNYYNCLTTTTGQPRVEAYEQNSTGASCDKTTPELTAGQALGFTVHDANQDGYWTFQYGGNSVFLNAESMGLFRSGIITNNGERGSSTDVAKADFDGLQRNTSNGWVNWNNTTLNSNESDDTGYKGCKYSDTHTSVILTSSTC
jgi:hypothetical protein